MKEKTISSLFLCVLFIGCNGGSKDSKKMVDANATTNEVRDELTKVGLQFNGYGGAFNTQDSIVAPCDQVRLKAIDQSLTKLSSLEDRLRTNGQDTEASDVRHNYIESLAPIQKELGEFCSQDYDPLSACLGAGRILVYLNKNQVGMDPVSPVLIPFDLKSKDRDGLEYGIYRLENNGETLGFIRIYKDGRTSLDRLDSDLESIYRLNHEDLVKMSSCVSTQNIQSATGMQVQKFLSLAAKIYN